jgi:L-alanine-DL-glutamate epimerase-like enolase superfamily enzyme
LTITDVEIIPVSVPFVEPFEIAGGVATHGRHVIVRIVSRSGEVGYGESAPMSSYSPQTQDSVTREIVRVKGKITGSDPLEVERIHQDLNAAGLDCFAKAGIDIALHDLAAKTLGIPVYDMLGGRVGDGVDLSWAIGFKSPDAMAAEARRYVDTGFRTIKIKVGENPSIDVERTRAVRDAIGPEPLLKVDANQGYDLETTIDVAKQLEELDVSIIEQPLPKDDISGLARLREETTIPIMVDESLFGPPDALKIIEQGAADVFNIKIMKPGGIRPSGKLASVAEAAGIPCMVGSMPELGIGSLGGLHLAVTSSVFTYGAELIGSWMFQDDLLVEPPRLEDGRMMAPEEPGLGIDVDEGKLEKYSIREGR